MDEFTCYVCKSTYKSGKHTPEFKAKACGHSSCDKCIPISYTLVQFYDEKSATFKCNSGPYEKYKLPGLCGI